MIVPLFFDRSKNDKNFYNSIDPWPYYYSSSIVLTDHETLKSSIITSILKVLG
jgi:hypothetical protein